MKKWNTTILYPIDQQTYILEFENVSDVKAICHVKELNLNVSVLYRKLSGWAIRAEQNNTILCETIGLTDTYGSVPTVSFNLSIAIELFTSPVSIAVDCRMNPDLQVSGYAQTFGKPVNLNVLNLANKLCEEE